MPSLQVEDLTIPQICLPLFLPSKLFYQNNYQDSVLHMSAHCGTRSCSPLKTVLGKIRDRYQAYCTKYEAHAMATHNRGTGCALDRGMDILTEDPEHTDINDGSTHSSDATVALGGPEAVGHPKDPVYGNQDKLIALMRDKQLASTCSGWGRTTSRDLGLHRV